MAQGAGRAPRERAVPRHEIIKERTEELAELEARDNGMNTTAAKHIISVANGILQYYAGWVGKIHGESSSVVSDGLLGG